MVMMTGLAALQWSHSASHIVGAIPLLHSYIL